MNPKQRIISCLEHQGQKKESAVTLEWWGLYKYEFSGLDYSSSMFTDGETLVPVYENFYNYFQPGWFHLHIGTPRYFKNSGIISKGNDKYLSFRQEVLDLKSQDKYFSARSDSKLEKVIDAADYILESKKNRPKVDLSSRVKIDEYISRFIWMDSELIIKLGYTDHVQGIAARYGHEVFINVHLPSQICEILDPITGYLGFEEGLLAFYDYPQGMKYFIEKCYEAQLEWVKAYSKMGAHGFNISEDNMAADTISPEIYRKFLKPVHRDFFYEVKKQGLHPLLTFWGDVNPLLEDLKVIGIEGLALDESRKNYVLDVNEIMQKIGDEVCLFGNLDSVNILLFGGKEVIQKELLKQKKAMEYGNFIFQNGSPLAPATNKENIMEFMDFARNLANY